MCCVQPTAAFQLHVRGGEMTFAIPFSSMGPYPFVYIVVKYIILTNKQLILTVDTCILTIENRPGASERCGVFASVYDKPC